MSILREYRDTELAIKELQERLHKLESDDKLKVELDFEGKLRDLMSKYGKSLRDVVAILDPDSNNKVQPGVGKPRRERQIKRYKNPHTGEVIETKGGNHKVLKAWKEEHGAVVVESWLE